MRIRLLIASLCIGALMMVSSAFVGKKNPKVLVFYKTAEYYHKCIPAGLDAFQKLGVEYGIDFTYSKDSLDFNDKNLKKFGAIVFFNTTGNVLDEQGQEAMQKFIRSGKGYVGIHSAADTEYKWPWYNQLVGAWFKNHPEQQEAKVKVADKSFSGISAMPEEWSKLEEWYNFRDTHWDKTHTILTLDEKSYKGGANGDYHPIAWYQEFDGGRSFYTGIGHRDETFTDPIYLKHIAGGLAYALGGKNSSLNKKIN